MKPLYIISKISNFLFTYGKICILENVVLGIGFYSRNKKILSLDFFLDLSVILRKILRIVNTDPDDVIRSLTCQTARQL